MRLLPLLILAACTAEPLRDRPEGMLAPFPADAQGREVPWERMVPYLVQQSVALAVRSPPRPPAAARALPLLDPRNEPVLVLAAEGTAGIGAAWPADRTFTLRPPTRAELAIAPLGDLDAGAPWDRWQPALAWLRAEANRPRPGLQRFSDAVLIVADADSPASDARAAAAVLTRMGAARKARVAVVGAGGLWAALALAPATLPVAALEEREALARPAGAPATGRGPAPRAQERGAGAPDPARASPHGPPPLDDAARLEAALALPIPGPRCLEVQVPPGGSLRAAVESALAGAGPQDVVAVPGFEPTLAQFLDPSPLVGAAAAPRVMLGDRCE